MEQSTHTNEPKIISKGIQHKGAIYTSTTEEIELPDGEVIIRDVVIKNNVAVAIVHNIETDAIILTKEFRVGSMKYELGGVAGIVESGEHALNAIVRETIEETGYVGICTTQYLGATMTSSGFTNERVHHFYIQVGGERIEQKLDADESIEVVEIPFGEFIDKMINCEITSNHLHACYLKYMLINQVNIWED